MWVAKETRGLAFSGGAEGLQSGVWQGKKQATKVPWCLYRTYVAKSSERRRNDQPSQWRNDTLLNLKWNPHDAITEHLLRAGLWCTCKDCRDFFFLLMLWSYKPLKRLYYNLIAEDELFEILHSQEQECRLQKMVGDMRLGSSKVWAAILSLQVCHIGQSPAYSRVFDQVTIIRFNLHKFRPFIGWSA